MRLYRAGHATFAAYCAGRWKLSRYAAYRLLAVAEVGHNLRQDGESLLRARNKNTPDSCLISGRAAAALAGLPPEVQREVYQKAADEIGGEPTAEELRTAVEDWKDRAVAAINREEQERLAARRGQAQLVARGTLDRMEALTGRLEKLARRLDLAADAERAAILGERLLALGKRLQGAS